MNPTKNLIDPKLTEGGFRDWGYQLAQDEFAAKVVSDGPWCAYFHIGRGLYYGSYKSRIV